MPGSRGRQSGFIVLFAGFAPLIGMAQPQPPGLPPPPVPPQNPITEAKRVLGKVLFWEEQLSSDNTVACGTCHRPAEGGADPRIGRHPGRDEAFNTPDDALGSPGVALMNGPGEYVESEFFGFDPQVTRRNSQSVVGSAYAAGAMFWDGRATGQFVDPESGAVRIPVQGALESQALQPILSDVEMGHAGRTWDDVRTRLENATPLALAGPPPSDVAAALAQRPSYPDLFAAAFGDPAITAERIAFAIATYERTLIPNQTPWDAFVAGNAAALTTSQQQGLNLFNGVARCNVCHTAPVFSNQTFRAIGLRPPVEDTGRQEVTGDPADRGRFKVPTLRNAGLKGRFMHNGRLSSLEQVVGFYANPALQFANNQDPVMATIAIPPQQVDELVDFLRNGLTDARVAAEQFPFDRPRLRSEMQPGDVDGDGDVDLADLLGALGTFGQCGVVERADFDRSGCVDLNDLLVLLGGLG